MLNSSPNVREERLESESALILGGLRPGQLGGDDEAGMDLAGVDLGNNTKREHLLELYTVRVRMAEATATTMRCS